MPKRREKAKAEELLEEDSPPQSEKGDVKPASSETCTQDDIEVISEEQRSHKKRSRKNSAAEQKPSAEETKPRKPEELKKQKRSSSDKDERTSMEATSDDDVFTLYVSGFPFDTDIEQYVRNNTTGVQDVRVHTWHDTGRSRGCAHVDYSDVEKLRQAIAKLHKATVGSRYLEAVQANAKSGQSVAPPPNQDDSRGGRRLFVKNLPYQITEDGVKTFFQKYGNVTHVRLPQWNHTENKKGFGYVQFEQKSFAVQCMKVHRENPLSISGRTIKLDYDEGKPKRGFKDEKGRAWYKPSPKVGRKPVKRGSE